MRLFLKFLKRFNYPPSINCKKGVRIVLRRRWFNCKRVFSYLFVTSFNSLMYNVPFFHCFFFLSFHHDWATLILFYFCPVFARGPTNRIFSLMAQKHKNQIDIVKGVLISETFLIWRKYPKNLTNHSPERFPFMWIVIRKVIWHLFLEVIAKEKNSMRFSHL